MVTAEDLHGHQGTKRALEQYRAAGQASPCEERRGDVASRRTRFGVRSGTSETLHAAMISRLKKRYPLGPVSSVL